MTRKNSNTTIPASEPAAKRTNIYKVTTHFPGKEETDHEDHTTVDYVKAKTKAGAIALIAGQYITAELAQPEDLLKLANISVKGG